MSGSRYDVCAVVVSDLPFDARVWKEARSLADAGYSVALLGCRYGISRLRRTREAGIDVVEIPLGERHGGVSQIGRGRSLLQLWLEVVRTPAHVYHVHNIHPAPAAWLAAQLRRARLVYDAHELYGDEGQSGVGGRTAARASILVERLLVQRSDAVITTNRSRAEVLARRHGRDGITVLSNVPAVVDKLEPLDPGYPSGVPILLYQGGVYAERAFRETLEALKMLEDVHLVILGFGRQSELERISGWAAELGLGERVHFLPARPFEDLARTAASATVGLVPIRSGRLNHYLGDTNKLHEYLMGGLPVVASDIPEVRRVVTEGDPHVGELFDASSPRSIADAIRRVLENPDVYAARRREARRLALERFNWRVEERGLLAIYDTLAGPARTQPREVSA